MTLDGSKLTLNDFQSWRWIIVKVDVGILSKACWRVKKRDWRPAKWRTSRYTLKILITCTLLVNLSVNVKWTNYWWSPPWPALWSFQPCRWSQSPRGPPAGGRGRTGQSPGSQSCSSGPSAVKPIPRCFEHSQTNTNKNHLHEFELPWTAKPADEVLNL